jgi:uracil-DNA glycosylase family 4
MTRPGIHPGRLYAAAAGPSTANLQPGRRNVGRPPECAYNLFTICLCAWKEYGKEVYPVDLQSLHEQIRNCQACRLCHGTTHAVPGEGPADAALMFVGEAPGFHEDQQGRPFVGAAGQFLEQLLASINMRRQDVYITNVVKHRPPNNRDPQDDEIAACRGFLDQQIALIKPKMIVTLGRFSMQLAYTGVSISRVHAQPKKIGDVVYFPMFHPAAALHQPKYRTMIEQDMLKIPELLAGLQPVAEDHEEPPPPQQLRMF